jgi:hypothetical protein
MSDFGNLNNSFSFQWPNNHYFTYNQAQSDTFKVDLPMGTFSNVVMFKNTKHPRSQFNMTAPGVGLLTQQFLSLTDFYIKPTPKVVTHEANKKANQNFSSSISGKIVTIDTAKLSFNLRGISQFSKVLSSWRPHDRALRVYFIPEKSSNINETYEHSLSLLNIHNDSAIRVMVFECDVETFVEQKTPMVSYKEYETANKKLWYDDKISFIGTVGISQSKLNPKQKVLVPNVKNEFNAKGQFIRKKMNTNYEFRFKKN